MEPPDAGPMEPPDAGPVSAFQCEGVPAPSDVFKATSAQCRIPEGVSGMGSIYLRSDPTSWTVGESLLRYDALDAYLAVPCGECELQSDPYYPCVRGDFPGDYNAGDITFTTDAGSTATLAYVRRAPDVYQRTSGTGPFFSGGETLRVSAAGGGDIAAFSHEMTLPSPVTITQPTPSSLPLPLRRGEDVEVHWRRRRLRLGEPVPAHAIWQWPPHRVSLPGRGRCWNHSRRSAPDVRAWRGHPQNLAGKLRADPPLQFRPGDRYDPGVDQA
jgi:hypothetical protein